MEYFSNVMVLCVHISNFNVSPQRITMIIPYTIKFWVSIYVFYAGKNVKCRNIGAPFDLKVDLHDCVGLK